MKQCKKCGAIMQDSMNFCTQCGNSLATTSRAANQTPPPVDGTTNNNQSVESTDKTDKKTGKRKVNFSIQSKNPTIVLTSILASIIVCAIIYFRSFPEAASMSWSPTILAGVVYILILLVLTLIALRSRRKWSEGAILSAIIPYVVCAMVATIYLDQTYGNHSYRCGILRTDYFFYNSLGRKIANGSGDVYIKDEEPVVAIWDWDYDRLKSDDYYKYEATYSVRIYNQDGVQIYDDDDTMRTDDYNEDFDNYKENIKSRLDLQPVY